MSALDAVMKYRAERQARADQEAQNIPNAVMAFMQGRQQAQKTMLDVLTLDATLASKGLKRTNQGIVRDESLVSPMNDFIQQGKIAQSYNQQVSAGFIQPGSLQSFTGSGGMQAQGGMNQLSPVELQRQNQMNNIPQASQSSQSDKNQESDTFATSATLNAANVATSTNVKSASGMTRELETKAKVKADAKKEEAKSGATEQSKSGLRFVQQYERSFDEIEKKIPGFSETGLKGKAKRGGASVLNMLDELPETSTLVESAEVFANRMVKSDEGGKITDKDRAVYAKTLVNTLAAPSVKNARLASNELISLADRGGDISENLVAFKNSKNATLNTIYQQTIEAHPDLKVVKIEDEDSGKIEFVTIREAKARGAK